LDENLEWGLRWKVGSFLLAKRRRVKRAGLDGSGWEDKTGWEVGDDNRSNGSATEVEELMDWS
jgi:hypothetical protein